MSLNVTRLTPASTDGDTILAQVAQYTANESSGITSLVIVSCLSLISIVALLCVIALSAFNTRRVTDDQLFVRTHMAAYFVSLLLCYCFQAIGSIMNVRWVRESGVHAGTFCRAQGVITQAADVGSALWIFVIILHTVKVLFTEWKTNKYILWATLTSGWSFIVAIVFCGPAVMNIGSRRPFYGISGYWCWISPEYPNERITLGCLSMVLAALTSVVLSTIIVLRLRGNLVVHGRRVHFLFSAVSDPADSKRITLAKQMLPFPIAYTLLILPTLIVRFMAWTGHQVSFPVLIFCTSVYLISGVADAILFLTIRHILPVNSVSICKSKISPPQLLDDESIHFGFNDPGPPPTASTVQDAPQRPAMRMAPTKAVAKTASAAITRFPPAPLIIRSNSYDSMWQAGQESAKHSSPPDGVPTDVEGRDSLESLYTDRMYVSPLEEVPPRNERRLPPTPVQYLSPR